MRKRHILLNHVLFGTIHSGAARNITFIALSSSSFVNSGISCANFGPKIRQNLSNSGFGIAWWRRCFRCRTSLSIVNLLYRTPTFSRPIQSSFKVPMLFSLFYFAFSAPSSTNSTDPLLESRPSAYERMLMRFAGEDQALRQAAKSIPKAARMFEPIIEMPPAKPPMDMMVPNDPKHPRVSVMYPRYCCRCRLTKNVSATDPIVQNWSSQERQRSVMHRIEKLQSLGAKQEQVEQYLKELERKVKKPARTSSRASRRSRSHRSAARTRYSR